MLSRAMKLLAVLLIPFAATAFAKEGRGGAEAKIREALAPQLGKAKIDAITKTPYAGLYELNVGGEVVYTDASGKYLIVGQVIDPKTKFNYTAARSMEINRVNFDDLPLAKAMKQVKGDGSRVIAVFEDPNCGYCKKLRRTLVDVDNVTIYTFLYNILSPDSAVKSRNIWCSPDRVKAYEDWMVRGKAPETASADCDAPNDDVLQLGKKLKINGTPAIFFIDGTRIPGAVSKTDLENKLKSMK